MKVIDFENFLLHPDLAVAEAAIREARFSFQAAGRGPR